VPVGQNVQYQCGRETSERHETPPEAQRELALPFLGVVVLLVLQPTGKWRVARRSGSDMSRGAPPVIEGAHQGEEPGCRGDESGQLKAVHARTTP
jgi:hypothetical protein